jgi:hypothetical protein
MSFDDAAADAAFQEIAGLLAAAYQRYAKIQRIRPDPTEGPVNRELAIRPGQSVHVNCT